MQLALDRNNNDLIFNSEGVDRIDKGRYTVQLVRNRLRVWVGEYKLNPTIGFLNEQDFIKDFKIYDIEAKAREIILTTKGVKDITKMSSTLEGRRLSINFKARTAYGEIEDALDWRF